MVKTSAAQRISLLGEEVEGFPVVLLSETGEPIKVAITDAAGNYEFTGLPDEKFDLVVALELDEPIMQDPLPVDVTLNDAIVNFTIGETTNTPVVLYTQTIAFNSWTAKTFGDAPFAPDMSVTSGLSVTLTSSDTKVATIEDNKIVIVGAGKTIITATQDGSGNYLAAEPVERELYVARAPQTITAPEIAEKVIGDPDFEYEASSTSGLPVSYFSSNKKVAKIENGKISIVGAGEVIIKSMQKGDDNYLAAEEVEQTLVVKKMTPSVTLGDIPEKTYGNPAFSLSIGNDLSLPVTITSANKGVATVNGTRVNIRGAGSTTIKVTIKGDNNYEAVEVSKELVVNKADQGITFAELAEVEISQAPFQLHAKTSSFLSVAFSSDNEAVATVDGNVVTIHSAGIANITATQEGNNNFNAAETVSRQLKVMGVVGTEETPNMSMSVYPNPAKDELVIVTRETIQSVQLTDVLGKAINNYTLKGNTINIQNLSSGMFYVIVNTAKHNRTFKINKQ
jgi:hypothetical protein